MTVGPLSSDGMKVVIGFDMLEGLWKNPLVIPPAPGEVCGEWVIGFGDGIGFVGVFETTLQNEGESCCGY